MIEFSKHLNGVSVTKIYKWNWDRRKRMQAAAAAADLAADNSQPFSLNKDRLA